MFHWNWHLAQQIKGKKKKKNINETKWHLVKFIFKLFFKKKKIDYNKTIMSTQNNLIIVTGSPK
jgi:hypothetical protein